MRVCHEILGPWQPLHVCPSCMLGFPENPEIFGNAQRDTVCDCGPVLPACEIDDSAIVPYRILGIYADLPEFICKFRADAVCRKSPLFWEVSFCHNKIRG